MVVEELVDSEDEKEVHGRSSKKYRRIMILDDSESEDERNIRGRSSKEYRSIEILDDSERAEKESEHR